MRGVLMRGVCVGCVCVGGVGERWVIVKCE